MNHVGGIVLNGGVHIPKLPNPQAVWWGADQTSRIDPKRAFVTDYANTVLLTFRDTVPDERYGVGQLFNRIMLAGTLPAFIADNVDTDYQGGTNRSITPRDNTFFWLPKGLWHIRCHVDDSAVGGAGHLSFMQVQTGLDDTFLLHTPGWQNSGAFGGTTFDIDIPAFLSDESGYYYWRFRRSAGTTSSYDYFMVLEKLD